MPIYLPMAIPHGSAPIERLRVSDHVLAEDPAIGRVGSEQVQAASDDGAKPTMRVGLLDGSDQQVITNHPFYADSGLGIATPGWVQEGDPWVGDRTRTADRWGVTVAALHYRTGTAPPASASCSASRSVRAAVSFP